MEIKDSQDLVYFVFIVSAVILFLVISIILFIVLSQKKAARQEIRLQRIKTKHQQDLFKSVISTQEKERAQIAKNIHDEYGASLSATMMMLKRLSNHTDGELKEMADDAKDAVLSVVTGFRNVINDLSPSSLKNYGLTAEIDKLASLVELGSGIKVEARVNYVDERYNAEVEINLYRVVKEFLANSMKYSKASKIIVDLNKSNTSLVLNLNDNGIGFDPKKINGSGHGLKNMESRVYLLNGKYSYFSEFGKGTELIIEIPLTEVFIKTKQNEKN